MSSSNWSRDRISAAATGIRQSYRLGVLCGNRIINAGAISATVQVAGVGSHPEHRCHVLVGGSGRSAVWRRSWVKEGKGQRPHPFQHRKMEQNTPGHIALV